MFPGLKQVFFKVVLFIVPCGNKHFYVHAINSHVDYALFHYNDYYQAVTDRGILTLIPIFTFN